MFICTFSISSLQCHSLSADIVCYAFLSEFQQATDSYVAMGGLGQLPPPQKHLFVATHNSNSYKYTEIGDISQLSRIADVSYGSSIRGALPHNHHCTYLLTDDELNILCVP